MDIFIYHKGKLRRITGLIVLLLLFNFNIAQATTSLPTALDLEEDQKQMVSPPSEEAIRRQYGHLYQRTTEEEIAYHQQWVADLESNGVKLPDIIANPPESLFSNKWDHGDALKTMRDAYNYDVEIDGKNLDQIVDDVLDAIFNNYYPNKETLTVIQGGFTANIIDTSNIPTEADLTYVDFRDFDWLTTKLQSILSTSVTSAVDNDQSNLTVLEEISTAEEGNTEGINTSSIPVNIELSGIDFSNNAAIAEAVRDLMAAGADLNTLAKALIDGLIADIEAKRAGLNPDLPGQWREEKPYGDIYDAYDRILDDYGNEYEKQPDGSWVATDYIYDDPYGAASSQTSETGGSHGTTPATTQQQPSGTSSGQPSGYTSQPTSGSDSGKNWWEDVFDSPSADQPSGTSETNSGGGSTSTGFEDLLDDEFQDVSNPNLLPSRRQ